MMVRRFAICYLLTTMSALAATERLNFSIVGADLFSKPRSLYTNDGGNIWLPSKKSPSIPHVQGWITTLTCDPTGQSCLAIGHSRNLVAFTTQDAGRTWDKITANFPIDDVTNVLSLTCSKDNKICNLLVSPYNTSDKTVALTTTDGGANWNRAGVLNYHGYNLSTACDNQGKYCIAVGNPYQSKRAVSYATYDDGNSWYVNAVPGDESANVEIDNIIYLNNNFAFMAVGSVETNGDRSVPAIFKTLDGGAHWHTTELIAPDTEASALITAVTCNDKGHCVALGQEIDPANPQYFKLISYTSEDLGDSWRVSTTMPKSTGAQPTIEKVKCSDDMKHCTAIGRLKYEEKGLAYYSTDGGDNWTQPEYFPGIMGYAIA